MFDAGSAAAKKGWKDWEMGERTAGGRGETKAVLTYQTPAMNRLILTE